MTSNRYAMWCCSRLSCVRNRTGNGLSASSTSSGNRRCSCWIPRGRQCQIRPITPDLIGLCGSLFDEALTTPVKCQYGLLLSGFDRHEPHVRSSDGFTNSFSVCSIMLIGFNIGFDELRGHQFDIMAHRYQFIGPEMSRCTGLHADQTGWDVGKKEAICARLSCLLNNRFPCSSTPWIWKKRFLPNRFQ
jgi:hypothetical protein